MILNLKDKIGILKEQVFKMSTPNYDTKNFPDWKLWFVNESLRYQRWFVYLLLMIITNLSILLYFVFGRRNTFGWLLMIPLLLLIINEIAYKVRIKDVTKILEASLDLTETKTITVTSIKRKEINKNYCYIYMKACGERVELGHKYQITYLKNTMGKYIIAWTDLDKEAKVDSIETSLGDKENTKVIMSEPVKENIIDTVDTLTMEETRKALEERGIDIEEIKKEIYDRNDSLDTKIKLDIEGIINKKRE